jgi:hypothetical protein
MSEVKSNNEALGAFIKAQQENSERLLQNMSKALRYSMTHPNDWTEKVFDALLLQSYYETVYSQDLVRAVGNKSTTPQTPEQEVGKKIVLEQYEAYKANALSKEKWFASRANE